MNTTRVICRCGHKTESYQGDPNGTKQECLQQNPNYRTKLYGVGIICRYARDIKHHGTKKESLGDPGLSNVAVNEINDMQTNNSSKHEIWYYDNIEVIYCIILCNI